MHNKIVKKQTRIQREFESGFAAGRRYGRAEVLSFVGIAIVIIILIIQVKKWLL